MIRITEARTSAKSGVIGANDESWLKTTMYGEGTFKFYYKKDAGTNDTFRFKIDGSTKFSVYNSSKSWEQKTYVITEVGLHTMEWLYFKGSSGTTDDGGAWVDRIEWTPSGQNSTSLQDGLDTTWPVVTAGDADWYNYSDYAYSGSIYDDEVSQMEVTAEGSGTVSFDWGVDSEEGYDYLQFYIDGTLKDEISGYVSSQSKSYSVGSGTHSLLWQYIKDGGGGGSDYGWVDNLQGPGTEPDPLAEAMDSSLTFTTGGDLSFSGSSNSPYYYDGDAARSGYIDDDEETWMQTTYTASAGDKVSFFWKVSSESGDDLKFYIDDSLQNNISGEKDWQKKSYALSAGSRTLKWVYAKDSATSEGDDCGWVDGLYVGPSSGSLDPEPPGDYAEAVDSSLKFTSSGDSTWRAGSASTYDYYYDADSAQSYDELPDSNESILQTIVDSASSETLKFYWKVSSNENDDYLEFYIDGTRQDRISGEVDWTQKEYTISAGIHTLKWRYVRSYEDAEGDNCGWVDFVQWTGASPVPDSENWQQLDYKYDVYGRRSEKLIDGYATRYLYDGDHVIAEYDGNNNLMRKFIYGPGVDKPVSMIEVADSSATYYYYHYDAHGSVVALSDSSGDTVQTYEYSVFGEVYVEDADHTNPYMFAGRRYDIEIGLYYNRARYYNPYTGRFLQTDPIGYGDGINWYAYCRNNSVNFVDHSGTDIVDDDGFPGGDFNQSRFVEMFPKPDYPANWKSWTNFFGWYGHGEGKAVDLLLVGLLDDFRLTEEISDWTRALQEEMDDYVRVFAEGMLSVGYNKASETFERLFEYDFAKTALSLGVKVLMGDPLVVLGGGTLTATVTISAERLKYASGEWMDTARWYVNIEYAMVDSFKDLFDIWDKSKEEVDTTGSKRYDITANWSYVNSGIALGWVAAPCCYQHH